MNSSSSIKKNKVSPSMSIIKSRGLDSSSELKQFGVILFKQLAKNTKGFHSHEEVVDAREESAQEEESAGEESDASVCTVRKLRRIKRKLFLDAAKAPRVHTSVQTKLAYPTSSTGKE